MRGIAKTLFEETVKRTPWKENPREKSSPSWPTLEYFLSIQGLSYVDFAFAEKIWQEYPHLTEEAASFICHLMLAARQGHLCVKIDQQNILPDVSSLWSQEASTKPQEEQLLKLNQMILAGSAQIPQEQVTSINANNLSPPPPTLFCQHENCFYLQKHWVYETAFMHDLNRVSSATPLIKIDANAVTTFLSMAIEKQVLLPEQAEAIKQAATHSLSIITGGPGTGKTYTAGLLIKTLWNSLSPLDRSNYEIAIAAPTGKAAANLQKSLTGITQDLPEFKPLTAKTLHSLLKIGKGASWPSSSPTRLSADLILIDESSMVDIQMMAALFGAIKEGARVILLGDQYQLPSVEAGGILADLILCQIHNIGYTQLNKCMRTDLKAIVEFASAINAGDSSRVLSLLEQSAENSGISRLPSTDHKKAKLFLLQHIEKAFSEACDGIEDPENLIDAYNRVRVLSPLRKGPYGVEEWNTQLLNQFRTKALGKESFVAPIMVISNDYRQDLFNGETGILIRKQKKGINQSVGEEDYALFPSRIGGQPRRIQAVLLPKFEYAYCLSVHKSQGSEFERVILLMPEGSEWFGREIFYTGVTRAKKSLEIYGEDAILKGIVERQCQRLSGINVRYQVV